MARTAYERGTRFVSFSITITDTDAGAPIVPSITAPYLGDEIGLGPYMKGVLPRRIAWDVKIGTPSSLSAMQLDLQGSLNGTNWFSLDTYASVANTLRPVVDKPVLYLRVQLTSFTLVNNSTTTLEVGIAL